MLLFDMDEVDILEDEPWDNDSDSGDSGASED